MGETASLVSAKTFISIVRAFEYMTISAFSPFIAVTKARKCAANWRGRVNADVGISALLVRTVAAKEMHACWDAVWGGLMGKITTITKRAFAFEQVVLANGNLMRIMYEATMRAFGT